MTIKQFCDGIGLEPELTKNVVEYELEENVYERYRALFYKDKEEFMEALKEQSDENLFALAVYVRLAIEAYDSYKKRGISDEIYFHTFSDFAIWSRVCKEKYGKMGIRNYGWLSHPIKLELFRLGRLQFEPEGNILNVHIPEGEPLNPEECKKSFEKAKEFFGHTYEAYVCESWLLAPGLKELLPEDSNIIKFQNMFEIEDVSHEFRQAEERVFGEISENREAYPEKTALQRALKQYVLSGKEPGMGIGRKMR